METCLGILIPFVGTTIGAAMVFFMGKSIKESVEKILLGFASGVMIAASVWSLLIPAIDMSEEQGKIAWLLPTLGFLTGIIFLLIIDKILAHFQLEEEIILDHKASKMKKTSMLVLAVTLHNIPEGMAVGVVFAGAMIGNAGITMASAFALAIGIAIQNFPEGAIISMPLKGNGMSKGKAFLYGTLSGIVEPIGAVITIYLTSLIVPVLPFILAFAAGAMIYVVVEELIPEAQDINFSRFGIIGVSIGFSIMMILDVALG